MKKIMASCFGLLALANVAQAKELTFIFDVHSSGPMIYACNAGISHPAPPAGQYCFLANKPHTTENACTPASSSSAGTHDCVCVTPPGDALLDFMRVQYRNWGGGQWGSTPTKVVKTSSYAYNSESNVVDFGQPAETVLKTKLDKVTFELGSERYGATYFIDVCFRGPQIDYYSADPNWNVTGHSFAYTSNLSVTDIASSTSNESYLGLAKPHYRAKMICDQQAVGNYKFAHNGTVDYWEPTFNGQYDQFDSDLTFGAFNDLNSDFVKTKSGTDNGYVALSSAWEEVFSGTIAAFPKSPRFCVVRYEFKETSVNERKWQRHDARFVTKTKIWEP